MEDAHLHHPHDHFFKETFSRPENAVAFFQAFLPREIGGAIQWSTLKREQGSFLDETLRERASDLLFTVKWNQRKTALLYCLFEHQSDSDRLMSLRLLRYQVRIWDDWVKHHPREELPLIVSIVLYQGERPWSASTRFVDLIDVPDGIGDGWKGLVPDFQYELIQIQNEETLEVMEKLSLRVVLKILGKHSAPSSIYRFTSPTWRIFEAA